MELRTLRYFVTVAQQGTMTGAAEKLFVTQPALSRQIADLERELGAPLFARKGKRITLTEDGELFYHRAVEIIEKADEAKAAFGSAGQAVEGDVFIGIGESANMRQVFRIARNLSFQHPKITFHFTTGDSTDLRHKLLSGHFDYIVAYERGNINQNLAYRRLAATNRIVLYVRPDHPLAQKSIATIEDLTSGRIVTGRQFLNAVETRNWLGSLADELDVSATYNLPFNGMLMVEEGLADFMLNYDELIPANATSLKRLELDVAPESSEFLVWQQDRKFSRAARLFKDTLLDSIGA